MHFIVFKVCIFVCWKIYWLYKTLSWLFSHFKGKKKNRHLKTFVRKGIFISTGTHHIIHFLLNTRQQTSHQRGVSVSSYILLLRPLLFFLPFTNNLIQIGLKVMRILQGKILIVQNIWSRKLNRRTLTNGIIQNHGEE